MVATETHEGQREQKGSKARSQLSLYLHTVWIWSYGRTAFYTGEAAIQRKTVFYKIIENT